MRLRSSSLPCLLRQDTDVMHRETQSAATLELLAPLHATSHWHRPASLTRNLSAPLPQLDSRAAHLVRPRKCSHRDARPAESKKLESSLSDLPSARTYTIAARNSSVVPGSGSVDSHAADIVQPRKLSSRDTSTSPSTKLESSINYHVDFDSRAFET